MNGDNQSIIISNRAKAVIFVALAIVLVAIGIEESLTGSERAYWGQMMPDASYLGTSPVAQDLIRESQEPAGDQPPATPAAAEITKSQPAAETTAPQPVFEREPPTNVSTGVLGEYSEVIVIDKIGAVLPIIESDTFDNGILHDELDAGVVLYPASMPFGTNGQTVLLGHSAPDNWPKIKNDTAFSRIDELAAGDIILVYSGDKLYRYQVTRTEVIAKGGDLSGTPPAGNSLVLVTCWPPGRDQNRIAVESVLIETVTE